jgi:hypothetical protein
VIFNIFQSIFSSDHLNAIVNHHLPHNSFIVLISQFLSKLLVVLEGVLLGVCVVACEIEVVLSAKISQISSIVISLF